MKNTLRNILASAVIGVSALGLASKVKADTPIMSFSELCYTGTGTSKALESFRGPPADNMMYRTDPNDPTGASDVVVSKEGYRDTATGKWIGEKWDAGFIKYVEGGILIGAYANNNNSFSNRFEGYEGYMQGKMYYSVFGDGERPDDLILMHDLDGNGIGNNVNGVPTLDMDNNQMYLYPDLLIKGKRGDTSELPELRDNTGVPTVTLPHITISPYAEISAENRGAKAIYLNGLREGTSGPLDLLAMTEYWMTNGHGEHDYHANGADWDTDGDVDMQDFALMSKAWSPENYLEWKPQTIFGAYPLEEVSFKASNNFIQEYLEKKPQKNLYNPESFDVLSRAA